MFFSELIDGQRCSYAMFGEPRAFVTPAQAGAQFETYGNWAPACAGVTVAIGSDVIYLNRIGVNRPLQRSTHD